MTRRKKPFDWPKEKCLEFYYEKDFPIAHIALIAECHPDSVSKRFKELGIEIKKYTRLGGIYGSLTWKNRVFKDQE